MRILLECEIIGDFVIEETMDVVLHPFKLNVRYCKIENKYYISISKRFSEFENFLSSINLKKSEELSIVLPPKDIIQELTSYLQLIELFGSIDKNVEN